MYETACSDPIPRAPETADELVDAVGVEVHHLEAPAGIGFHGPRPVLPTALIPCVAPILPLTSDSDAEVMAFMRDAFPT
jgi:hypothetical protein